MDWSPLAESDPLPGDPFATADLARSLRETAAGIVDVAGELRGIDAGGIWEGDAAEAFRKQRGDLLPRLGQLSDRYERVCGALDGWCRALDEARRMARDALTRARDAQDRAAWARRGLADAAQQAEAVRRAAEVAAASGFPPPVADPSAELPWQRELEEAEAEMAFARRLLGEAGELYEQAAARCASEIDRAIHDDLRNDDSLFAGFKRRARGLVERFPVIKVIASQAGLLAGALGIAALFFPPLGGAAFLAGVASTALDATVALAGGGGWGAVAVGGLGIGAFGLGRVAASMSRGTAAVKASREVKDLRATFGKVGALKNYVLRSAGGERIFGAAARSRGLKAFDSAARYKSEAVKGMFPSARNWIQAARFWEPIEIPQRLVLDLSPQAVRFAAVSRGFDVVGLASDSHGVRSGATELRGGEGEEPEGGTIRPGSALGAPQVQQPPPEGTPR